MLLVEKSLSGMKFINCSQSHVTIGIKSLKEVHTMQSSPLLGLCPK